MDKNKKVKVSVIVPVYNVENYLQECLESLVNQSLEDIEIIVVNDGSPDNSQKIIDKYAKKYPKKVKAYKKKNGGLSDARNFGISKATGEYIAFVDSDDFVDSKMFEKMFNYIKESKCRIAVCNLVKYNENNSKYIPNNFIKENTIIDITKDENDYLNKARSFACNKIFDRTLFEKFKFPVGQVFEDSAIIYNMIFECKKIFVTNEALYYYRINRKGAITTIISENIFDIFKSCDSIIKYHKQNNTFDLYYEKIEKTCLIHIFMRIKQFFKGLEQKKLKIEFINKAFDYFYKNFPKWKSSSYFGKKESLYFKLRRKMLQNKKILILNMYFPKGIKKTINKILRFLKKKRNFFKKNKTYVITPERLRDLQKIELEILNEIDRICKKNNIKYYLLEGSLLGCVRHQGFIPWDDDLDIGMLREDYEKFKEIATKELSVGYCLCSDKTIKNYHLPFMKVVTLNNRGFCNKDAKSLGKLNGPFIDVFPLDLTSKSLGNYQLKKYKKIRKYRDILLIKTNYHIRFSWKRVLYYFEAMFYSNKKLHSKIYKLLTKEQNLKHTSYIANYASSYKIEKEIFPMCTFGEGKKANFEGVEVNIPVNANYVLTRIYGDYMKVPPKEKQKTQHSICDMLQKTQSSEEE